MSAYFIFYYLFTFSMSIIVGLVLGWVLANFTFDVLVPRFGLKLSLTLAVIIFLIYGAYVFLPEPV